MRTPLPLVARLLLVALSTAAMAGCGDDGGDDRPDTSPPDDSGVIILPDSDTNPHCIDAIPIIDIDIDCTGDEECEEALAPIPACQRAACEAGKCVFVALDDETDCDDGNPCTDGEACLEGVCTGGTSICSCPAGMVSVEDVYCIDQYEASRPDATASSAGTDTTVATSRAGVIPWFPAEYAEANQACRTAGKRLCTVAELQGACAGPDDTVYPYGDAYDATTCNGIDAFCNCDSPNCSGLAECPYPHCYNEGPDGEPGDGCGAALHVVPTGVFAGCVNEYGAFDLSGNLWELADRGDESSWYVGGAYNCLDSEYLHRCDGLEQNISAKGFRCCTDHGTGD